MIDSLSDYLFFVTIVEEGSLTLASRKLSVPKSKLSRHLAQLEKQLGSQLLVRTTRRQTLTENGLQLYQLCKPHVEALSDIETTIGESAFKVKGTLRLLLPSEFFNKVISSLITDFALAYSDIEIHCHHYAEEYPEFDHQYDLVFVLHEEELPDSNWIGRTLLSFPQSIYSKENKCASAAKTISDLGECSVVCSNEKEQWLFRSADKIQLFTPKRAMVFSSQEMRVEACQRGVGLIKLPDYIAAGNSEIKPVDLTEALVAQRLTLLYQNRNIPAKTRTFLDYFQSKIGCLS